MGVRQVYRGNPALKSTYLISDLSNGIDIINSDEVISTKSMRDLVNVELGEAGIIKKRKGFSKDNILNRIIREYYEHESDNIDLELSNYLDDAFGVFLLSDKKSVLSRMEDYEKLDDFLLGYGVGEYVAPSGKVLFNIDLLIVSIKDVINEEDENLNFKRLNFTRLNIRHDNDGINVTFNEMLENGIRIDGKLNKRKITGLNAIDFDNKLYIELSQIAESLKGYVEIGVENDEYYIKVLNTGVVEAIEGKYDKGIYEPTPYEVLNYGFNVLADDPLNTIAYTDGAKRIFSFYLTDYNNPKIPLTRVPSNGKFRVVAIVSGFESPDDLSLKIFQKGNLTYKDGVPELKDNELSFSFVSEVPQENSAIFHYKIELNIPNNNEITIELSEDTESDISYDREFDQKVALTSQVYVRKVHINKIKKVSNYNYIGTAYTNVNLDTGEQYFDEKIASFHGRVLVFDDQSKTIWGRVHLDTCLFDLGYEELMEPNLFFETNPELKSKGLIPIMSRVGSNFRLENKAYFYGSASFVSYENMPPVLTLVERLDNKPPVVWTNGEIVYVHDKEISTFADMYLRYNGSETVEIDAKPDVEGWDAIFDEIVEKYFTIIPKEELLPYSPIRFTLTFDSGSEDDLKEVTPLDITNIRNVIINDRMVFFKENSIWYSDVFKFNYFPFYNYITLPLRTDDSIVEIHYFKGSHIIFTRQEIWKIDGMLGYDNMVVSKVNDLIGCVAPETVQPQNNTLVFLSQDGLYALKQTMYSNGLENVDKIDDHINGLINENNTSVESIVHNGIYHLHTFDVTGNYVESFRQYYNRYAGSSGRYPYTRDIYSELPYTTFKFYGNIYGVKDGNIFLFDKGYKDFNTTYDMIVETPQYTLDYPMHEKKIKDITFKVRAFDNMPVSVEVMYGDNLMLAPNTTHYRVNQFGEIEYEEAKPYQINTEWVKLGDFELGKDYLGNNSYQIHKLLVGGKTENVSLRITHSYEGEFNLHAIGFTFKLGKVRGRRN